MGHGQELLKRSALLRGKKNMAAHSSLIIDLSMVKSG